MTQDTDTKRTRVLNRLNECGFKPRATEQILSMVDAMMTGRITLPHVLVAATEVCKVCDLGNTHQHVADALTCLAEEILQCQSQAWGDGRGAPCRTRSRAARSTPKRRGRADQASA